MLVFLLASHFPHFVFSSALIIVTDALSPWLSEEICAVADQQFETPVIFPCVSCFILQVLFMGVAAPPPSCMQRPKIKNKYRAIFSGKFFETLEIFFLCFLFLSFKSCVWRLLHLPLPICKDKKKSK